MKTAEEIAQYVINNRYPKSEQDKVSDHEMYHTIVDDIKSQSLQPSTAEGGKTAEEAVLDIFPFKNDGDVEDSIDAIKRQIWINGYNTALTRSQSPELFTREQMEEEMRKLMNDGFINENAFDNIIHHLNSLNNKQY